MMKKIMLMATMAIWILVAGCNENIGNMENGSETGQGSLRIAITSETGSGSRMVNSPTQEVENTVHKFAAIVFNYQSGVKEKHQEFTSSLEGVVTDLSTATTKRVVVVVNHDSNILSQINNYSDLNNLELGLESQAPGDYSTNGLFMSGESEDEIVLLADQVNTTSVIVRRVVAKVVLENLIIAPTAEYSLSDFTLMSVSMQKVPNKAYMFGESIPVLGSGDYRGGLDGSVSTSWSNLYDAYQLPANYVSGNTLEPNLYYYVFPNDDSQDNPTMVTLTATYEGTLLYYTFILNDTAVAGQSDGTFIKRNTVYGLHITLRRIGLGGSDPDSIERFVELEVTVNVANWEGGLIQYLEW